MPAEAFGVQYEAETPGVVLEQCGIDEFMRRTVSLVKAGVNTGCY